MEAFREICSRPGTLLRICNNLIQSSKVHKNPQNIGIFSRTILAFNSYFAKPYSFQLKKLWCPFSSGKPNNPQIILVSRNHGSTTGPTIGRLRFEPNIFFYRKKNFAWETFVCRPRFRRWWRRGYSNEFHVSDRNCRSSVIFSSAAA